MSENIRAFIAIELNKKIQDELAKIQNEIKASGALVKWVKPENIHLTLKFLGNIDTDLITKIKDILNDLSSKHEVFTMKLNKVGAFPKPRNPRIIWVGQEDGQVKIKSIAEELEENLSKIGIPKEEKPFHSHVTLGRVKSPLNRFKLAEALTSKEKIPELSFAVDRIVLFKSTLTSQGPIYEAIAEVNLKAS